MGDELDGFGRTAAQGMHRHHIASSDVSSRVPTVATLGEMATSTRVLDMRST